MSPTIIRLSPLLPSRRRRLSPASRLPPLASSSSLSQSQCGASLSPLSSADYSFPSSSTSSSSPLG
ncbi:hypothetical protein B0H12DRAFT_1091493 [Mycena haematopus]|nr:hypothetical protein B0H12DRAFT_1136720 [Mycena haematopus]KAJ7272654.1 hypothetical protein B0H12DRAFT_1091493 [Mycena haematopus]